MKNKNSKTYKIKELFRAKKRTHKELAKIPFEEKVAILYRLQEIAKSFKPA